MKTINVSGLNGIEQIRENLWKKGGKYYRLFATGVTPNGCWLLNAEMRELVDIDIASGEDVFGDECLAFDCVGTVPAAFSFITRKKERGK